MQATNKTKTRTVQKAIGLVNAYCKKYKLLTDTHYFVGVSGGADSLALAAILSVCFPDQITALIVDHSLQTGSEIVAQNASLECQKLGISAKILNANLENGANLEARARNARYSLLESVAQSAPIFLAHTLNDQAETLLLGLGRSSGLSALHGMSENRQNIHRPFLELTRNETEKICKAFSLEFWNDPTNGTFGETNDNLPSRSKLRNTVIPAFEHVFPGVQKNLARTAKLVQMDEDYLENVAKNELQRLSEQSITDINSENSLCIEGLLQLEFAIRFRVLAKWLKDSVPEPLPFERLSEINNILLENLGHGGKIIQLEGGAYIKRNAGLIEKFS